VCDFKDRTKSIDNGLAFFELIMAIEGGKSTFQIIESFQAAVCENPGSALLDLLEEVVACKIGCAVKDNVFCSP